MIKKIGCVEIPVSDMKRAVDFYEITLKLKKTYEHPVWTSFDVGGVSFALAASGTKKKVKGAEVCTSCSMCVLRYAAANMKQDKETPSASSVINMSVDDLDESYKSLTNQGVKFVTKPKDQAWGGRTAVMLDPDENIIVLSQM
jgi:predicted enzyme related to lactoylglutathione lyase